MTRLEWFASQPEGIRDAFEYNCDELNEYIGINNWLYERGDNEPKLLNHDGIRGAFVWRTSKEGHDMWSAINKDILSSLSDDE
jgi:hypothetical protein